MRWVYAIFALVFSAASAQQGTIVDVAKRLGATTLLQLVEDAGLTNVLSSKGNNNTCTCHLFVSSAASLFKRKTTSNVYISTLKFCYSFQNFSIIILKTSTMYCKHDVTLEPILLLVQVRSLFSPRQTTLLPPSQQTLFRSWNLTRNCWPAFYWLMSSTKLRHQKSSKMTNFSPQWTRMPKSESTYTYHDMLEYGKIWNIMIVN